MKCKFCSNPATVHLTDIVNKTKHEMHLCEACAREKKLIPEASQELSVPAILQLVLGQMPAPAKSAPGEGVCPDCGMPYAHFRAQGRLGCPSDYVVFRPLLEPLVEKVQNGSTRHSGKRPARLRQRFDRARRADLEAQLKLAVDRECYEEAARLRDEIRALGGKS